MEGLMETDGHDNRMEQDIAKRKQDLSGTGGQQNKQKSKSSSCIMPVFEEILQNKAQQLHPPVASAGEKEFVRKIVEKISRPQQQDRSAGIPSLDLGGQILAQQRKIAALKRKSPGQENDVPQNGKYEIKPQQPLQIQPPLGSAGGCLRKESQGFTADGLCQMPPAPLSPQQKIIADIVAKEILALTTAG
jgi:hypothetical protein